VGSLDFSNGMVTSLHVTSYQPPFKYRVPNAPALFLGRDAEMERLRLALGRFPVAVLVGSGGMGKSGLARAFVHGLAGTSGMSAVQVVVRPDDRLGQLLGDILAALKKTPQDGEPEDAMEAVLAAAEDRSAVVLMEDLHHLPAEELATWLDVLASYARGSRWVATTRADPTAFSMREQVVRLGPLSGAACDELVAACAPTADAETRRAIVTRSAGQPLEARRLAVGWTQNDSEAREVLGAVPETGRELVETLAHTQLPLSLDDLGAAVTLPASEVLELLALAGILVTEGGERVRLHDAMRGRVASEVAPTRTGAIREALSSGLGERTDPDALLEAVRSSLDAGKVKAAGQLLDARFGDLAKSGLTERLWRVLRAHAHQLPDHALRAAFATNTSESLRWAAAQKPPEGASLQLRYDWIRARQLVSVRRRGVVEDALALAADARAGGQETLAFDATYMAADAMFGAGRVEECLEALAQIAEGTSSVGMMVRRDALMSRATELNGDLETAVGWAMKARRRAEGLPPSERLSALRRAHLVTVPETPGPNADAPLPEGGFWPVFLAGLQAGLNGDGPRCSAAYAALDPDTFNNATEHVMYHLLGMFRGFMNGPTADIYSSAQQAVHRARSAGDWLGMQWATLGHSMASWVAIKGAPNVGWPEGMMPPAGPIHGLIQLMDDLHRMDADPSIELQRTPDMSPDKPDRASAPLDIADALGASMFAILRGRHQEALVSAARAVRIAQSPGLRFAEFVVRSMQLVVLATMDREAELQRSLEAYSQLIQQMDAAYTRTALRIMEAGFGPEPQVAEMEAIADEWSSCAVAAYWARHLLRGEEPKGLSHIISVAAMRKRWARIRVTRYDDGAQSAWRRGWGVDLASKTAWRLDGQVVDLSRRKTMRRLLHVLAEKGGEASKEELVEGTWDTEYHPLRDDTKLQVSMGRLRKLLGDDPQAPMHIVTIEDGYGVGPEVPFTVVEPAE